MTLHEKKIRDLKLLEAMLTDEEAYEVLKNYGRREGVKQLAKKYNVSMNATDAYLNEHNIHQPNEVAQQRRINTNIDRYGAGKILSKPTIDSDQLYHFYVEEMMDLDDLIKAFDYKYTRSQIKENLYRQKIKRPMKNNPNRKRSPEAIKKWKQTCFEKYGAENPRQAEICKEKAVKTCLEKYGYENVSQVPEIRYKQASHGVHSKFEYAVGDYMREQGYSIIPQYAYTKYIPEIRKSSKLTHAFDYAVMKDDKVDIVVDCDGMYFHNYFTENKNYTDNYRLLLAPSGIKRAVIVEQHEQEGYDYIKKIYDMTYDEYVQDIFNFCRQTSFPYPSYTKEILTHLYDALTKTDIETAPKLGYTRGALIVNSIHKSLWQKHKDNLPSPYNAWNDNEYLLNLIKNGYIVKDEIDRSKMLKGLCCDYESLKIETLNPQTARYAIHKYMNEYNTIFNPISNYSEVLIGTASTDKNYIGYTDDETLYKEGLDMINVIQEASSSKNSIKLYYKAPFDKNEIHDCLFVFLSFQNVGDTDSVITKCLETYDCKKYVFIVKTTSIYKKNFVEELSPANEVEETPSMLLIF